MNRKFVSLYFVSAVLQITDLKRSSHDSMHIHRPVNRINSFTKIRSLENFGLETRQFELLNERASRLIWSGNKPLAQDLTLGKEYNFGAA
jgi:hypothetical protein